MLRPRGGDFTFTLDDIALTVKSKSYILHETDGKQVGYVFGALTSAGEIDVDACRQVCRENDTWTFHRAFDLISKEKQKDALQVSFFR